jgi:hypothetical protein
LQISNSECSKKETKEEDIKYYEFEMWQVKDISDMGVNV